MNTKVPLQVSLRLTSDAELGSGLGGVVVNQYVPRNAEHRLVIPASHVKGLLREELGKLARLREWSNSWIEDLLGRGGTEGDLGIAGCLHLTDLELDQDTQTLLHTRTAISDLGTALDNSLRTNEAVPVGAMFRGQVKVEGVSQGAIDALNAPDDKPLPEESVKLGMAVLGLLCIGSVGSSRRRGAGRCVVQIDNVPVKPGQLLKRLAGKLSSREPLAPTPIIGGASTPRECTGLGSETTWLRLEFHARDPVCCPDAPVLESNVLRSGMGIPASAVQGALLTLVSRRDPALATACLYTPGFRAWPLLPLRPHDGQTTADEGAVPVRVALSHRMSKLANENGEFDFKDAAIEPYDWSSAQSGSPLKGTDGVLIPRAQGGPLLWKTGDMPRVVRAHGVHYQQRNLFTVQSQAPIVFAGLVAMPTRAAALLCELIEDDGFVSFGKGRTTRGGGNLHVEKFDFEQWLSQKLSGGSETRVFVVQSPIAIPDEWSIGKSERVLADLVKASGWGHVVDDVKVDGTVSVGCQAGMAVRFGWTRYGDGRSGARRVIQPGSVFVLDKPVEALEAMLRRGIGKSVANGDIDGRMAGFGAVLPHPGIATSRFAPKVTAEQLPKRKSSPAATLALKLERTAGRSGPSSSQIAALARRDGTSRRTFFDRQLQRAGRYRDVWRRVEHDLRQLFAEPNEAHVQEVLRHWRDLTAATETDGQGSTTP